MRAYPHLAASLPATARPSLRMKCSTTRCSGGGTGSLPGSLSVREGHTHTHTFGPNIFPVRKYTMQRGSQPGQVGDGDGYVHTHFPSRLSKTCWRVRAGDIGQPCQFGVSHQLHTM